MTETIDIETKTKAFLWTDKSGRGFSNTLTLESILNLDDEQDYGGNALHEWA